MAASGSPASAARCPKSPHGESGPLIDLVNLWCAALELIERAEKRPNHVYSASDFEAGVMVMILVIHGFRLKNLAELCLDVNLGLASNGVPTRFWFDDTKTGQRNWPFARKLLPYWQRYVSHFRRFLPFVRRSSAAFPSIGGRPISRRGLRDHFERALASTFLGRGLPPHEIRRLLASALVNDGMPDKAREILGHKDFRALRTYIANRVDSRKATECLQAVLEGYGRLVEL